MLETDSTPDRWINFVLQNGWRLNARVDEETGDLSIAISNENGKVLHPFQTFRSAETDWIHQEEIKETYKLFNEEENN